jgi:LL-diaminopimelate aminotransferase
VELAHRLQDIPPYPFAEIARLKERAKAEGWDVVDFGIGDPDIPPPECLLDAMTAAIHESVMNQYDETSWGLPEFLDAVAEWFTGRFGVNLDTRGGIKVTIGTKEALAHTAWTFINPDDVSLIPSPGYGVYAYNTRFAGGDAYDMPLSAENGFLPDLDAIPARVANRAKLLFLNYPNNPTGAVATLEFFKRAVAFADKYDILICSDAAYSEIYFGTERPHSILEVDGGMERAIEYHSLSKTFGMTGWRIGWICGKTEAVKGVTAMKSYVDSNVFPAIQKASVTALREGGEHSELIRGVYRNRRDILCTGLQKAGWHVEPPPATLYVWAPAPKGVSSADLAARILSEAHVLTIPGSAYGQGGEGFIRFSLTVKADDVAARIQEGVDRIVKLGYTW